MTTANTRATTAGDSFLGSDVVASSIARIVEELRTAQAAITGARPPREECATTMDEWLARAEACRGKGAFFRYLGTSLGNGPLVEMVDGSVKWDMINGIGVHMFGHSDPQMVRANLESALSDTVMQGNLQFNADSIEFTELIVEEAAKSSNIAHAFVTNSGAMANESALKICQQKTNGAPRIIAFQDCFMGRSTTMAQIGDSAGGRVGVPLNAHVDYMPFWDEDLGARSTEIALWHLDQQIARYPNQHACFIFELIQGEGGFNVAPREFFVPLMERCREAGIPVWADEVQTFGRTDSMYRFAGLDLGEYVDVVTIGKMSQACAALYTPEFNPKPGLLSGTFQASGSAFHVGLAALRTLRDGGFYGRDGRIAKLHAAFRTHAEALVAGHPEWFTPIATNFGRTNERFIGGTGGMMRITPFGGERAKIARAMNVLFEEGVISFLCGHGPYHLRFLPPVGVMQPEQFEPVFEIVERALARVAAEG